MLGYITYKRTYARIKDDEGNTEEFRDTILRILKASQNQLGVGFTNEELKKACRRLSHYRFIKFVIDCHLNFLKFKVNPFSLTERLLHGLKLKSDVAFLVP